MTNTELMQALRIDIAGELEAIFLYDAHYQATDDPAAKAVLADIRDEEKAHMGELITLMRHLEPHGDGVLPGRRRRSAGEAGRAGHQDRRRNRPGARGAAPAPTVGDLS